MKLINPNLIKYVIDLNPVQAGATYFKESQKHDHLWGGKFFMQIFVHFNISPRSPSYSYEFAGGRKVNIMVVVAALPMQPY